MAATKNPFARRCRPDAKLLWDVLRDMSAQIASERSIVGWPEFGSLYIEQCHPNPIRFVGQSVTEVVGPVRLKTRGRFFDIYDPPRDDVWCWGMLRPRENEEVCPWMTARISSVGGGRFSVETKKYGRAAEASTAAKVHPLEMMAKLYKLGGAVRDSYASELERSERLKGKLGALVDFLGGVIEACTLRETAVGVTMSRESFLGELDPALLGRSPFGLSDEVVRAIAAVRAGVG